MVLILVFLESSTLVAPFFLRSMWVLNIFLHEITIFGYLFDRGTPIGGFANHFFW
jgi:hypothetical protein